LNNQIKIINLIIRYLFSSVDLLKHRLEKEGYQVLTLSNGKEIISQLHGFVPDLIVLDLVMPEYGGLDICEMLNNDPLGSSTPIIVVTGLANEIDKKKAYSLGIQEYFVKPVDMEVLLKAIKGSIENKQ